MCLKILWNSYNYNNIAVLLSVMISSLGRWRGGLVSGCNG